MTKEIKKIYRQSIKEAYQKIFGRQPTPAQVREWTKQMVINNERTV